MIIWIHHVQLLYKLVLLIVLDGNELKKLILKQISIQNIDLILCYSGADFNDFKRTRLYEHIIFMIQALNTER